MEIETSGPELVVSFVRNGQVLNEFYCTDGTAVTTLARGLLALRMQPGDVLSVEWRRQPNLIGQGLG
jgi:hypothetical protein